MIQKDLCDACISYWTAEEYLPPCKETGYCPVYKEEVKKLEEK